MQNSKPARLNLSRRRLLMLLAAGGVGAVGGYALYEYSPWLNYDQQANQTRQLFAQDAAPSAMSAQIRELVRYATLAANGHNTQPWKFVITANTIEIHPDFTRRLPAVDPNDRELWISLGCALENLLVASRADGYAAVVTYPDMAEFIEVPAVRGQFQSAMGLGSSQPQLLVRFGYAETITHSLRRPVAQILSQPVV